MSTLLSLGHGYSARALARRLVPQGWRVIGTTRNPAKAEAFRSEGVEPLLWPGDLAPALAEATHILCSAAPDAKGDPFLQSVPGIAQAEAVWVGYLSTTGVYGDHDGGWVDEATPLTPQSDRGRQRVLAEDQWRATGLPLHVFRLAGIYGPGRGPFEKLRDGTARRIVKPGQVFSRIHVDDIVSAVMASFAGPAGVYNVADDLPASQNAVIEYACTLLGREWPPLMTLDEAQLSPMARGFYAENRRISNKKARRMLNWLPQYPDYKQGLKALLAAQDQKPD